MRILYVADGRSPIALSWMRYWIETGHQIHLVSTFPCDSPVGVASFHILPVAFSGMARARENQIAGSKNTNRSIERNRGRLQKLRYMLGPLTLPYHQRRFRIILDQIRPDIVHALRIPFEGMLASITPADIPLLVSVWGNDLTLHAHGSVMMARRTHLTLHRADALIADAARDIRLGFEWGFATDKPTLVVPGAGGICLDEIGVDSKDGTLPEKLPDGLIVVNPRGQRPGSLRQDIFFQSIPLVLEKIPQVTFVCPQMADDAESNHWVDRLEIRSHTLLWPRLDRAQMWTLYKKSQVYVSPSIHDGTPNSLLEAMACGCFPVVGTIESLQEWVTPGVNGLLVDATSPYALADGIISSLENPTLRATAKIENARVISERASYRQCMTITEALYQKLNGGKL